MWKCHKCGKPVYFAERKQSLGYDWHPECLRCEECGKRLNPGQHAEHKGVPYCHVPCYGALFGPQLFGHGTRVESHKSFGQKGLTRANTGPILPRNHLDSKLKVFNQFYDGRALEIRSREVNGRLVLEGALRIHWGVRGLIHLKEDDDQRTVVTIRKRNSTRMSVNMSSNDVDNVNCKNAITNSNRTEQELNSLNKEVSNLAISNESQEVATNKTDVEDLSTCPKSLTLPPKLDVRNIAWDELDDLLQVERKIEDSSKLYQTMPSPISTNYKSNQECPQMEEKNLNGVDKTKNDDYSTNNDEVDISHSNNGNTNNTMSISSDDSWIEKTQSCDYSSFSRGDSDSDCDDRLLYDDTLNNQKPRLGSTAIRRRPGARRSRTKLKRRCSINGHYYDRETSIFTPPYGSQMSVWVTSLVNTPEVINLMLEKYKVDSDPENFALFVVRDNGEQRRLKDDEYPLLVRVLLGPHEDVAKIFIFDKHSSDEVSSEVAQFLNLSLAECRAILHQYRVQEEKEIQRIILKYAETKKRIKQRMDDLKVRLSLN